MSALHTQACRALPPAHTPLSAAELLPLLAEVNAWAVGNAGPGQSQTLSRSFQFDSYLSTLAFVNQVAAMAEAEDHHPDIHFGWGRARVSWSTHSASGLTLRDFICAAKVDQVSRLFAAPA
jgi:4a-hydroxytetrahydrobiopterin dehydratase